MTQTRSQSAKAKDTSPHWPRFEIEGDTQQRRVSLRQETQYHTACIYTLFAHSTVLQAQASKTSQREISRDSDLCCLACHGLFTAPVLSHRTILDCHYTHIAASKYSLESSAGPSRYLKVASLLWPEKVSLVCFASAALGYTASRAAHQVKE